MSIEKMKQALEALENNKRTHYYCEDTWYSCPKHEDGCANEAEGDKCNCGADEANAEIDKAITSLRQAIELAQKQEPVAWWLYGTEHVEFEKSDYHDEQDWISLFDRASPPQRQPLTDEQWQEIAAVTGCLRIEKRGRDAIMRILDEAAHGIKE